jgi:hypothetical protein
MRLEYQRVDSLPRLAWCARIARGALQVRVRHGPWVETRGDRFFEGAWDGDFADGGFDAATAFTGSGCVARETEILCVASMNACEWLFALRDGALDLELAGSTRESMRAGASRRRSRRGHSTGLREDPRPLSRGVSGAGAAPC